MHSSLSYVRLTILYRLCFCSSIKTYIFLCILNLFAIMKCHRVFCFSETMSVQTFHYVQQQSENHYDLIQTDKKKRRLWSRRLHVALLAYRELFHTLSAMDKSADGTVRDSSRVIKSNIFYVPEYR